MNVSKYLFFQVNMTFFRQLYKLLQIAMPGIRSKEFWMLIIHSGFLGNL
jgi:ATP-binding cassette subfamily D (ALD) long-chain fatty acid import protein